MVGQEPVRALPGRQFHPHMILGHQHEEANVEYWFARELMPLLGYDRWENFDKAIIRAMESCEISGIEVTDHFREVTKMIENR